MDAVSKWSLRDINRYLVESRLCSIVENKIRGFVSEMLGPMNERLQEMKTEQRKINQN
jgi:hypothetical protein